MSQSQPLRIEHPEHGSFGTSKAINSRLWFVNNKSLEERMLGYLAKYREQHQIKLYSYAPQGNHYHLLAKFPECNRACFYRDFNARYAEAVRSCVVEFPGGPLFERRYSEQAVPRDEDNEERFFYCALQPVHAGLTERTRDYPAYNSFNDAISGTERKIRMIIWTDYNDAKRKNPYVPIKDYYYYVTLKFDRLPGYEHLSQRQYQKLMLEKYEQRRVAVVNEWKRKGHRFLTKSELLAVVPGSAPVNSKKSSRYSRRPLVLTSCHETRKQFLTWYFSIYAEYKIACRKYLTGDIQAIFPPRTYRPPGLMVPG